MQQQSVQSICPGMWEQQIVTLPVCVSCKRWSHKCVVRSEFANICIKYLWRYGCQPGSGVKWTGGWLGGEGVALFRVYTVDLPSGPQETLKLRSLKTQIFTAVAAKTTVFWNLTPCTLVRANEIFGWSWNVCVQYKAVNTVPVLYVYSQYSDLTLIWHSPAVNKKT